MVTAKLCLDFLDGLFQPTCLKVGMGWTGRRMKLHCDISNYFARLEYLNQVVQLVVKLHNLVVSAHLTR